MKNKSAQLASSLLLLLATLNFANAQTITITPQVTKIWAGANATNNLFSPTNALVVSNTVAFNSILGQADFALSTIPSGATLTLSTNSIASPGTSSASVVMNFFTTNVAAGAYPFTLSATDDGTLRASNTLTLFAAHEWNTTAAGNWTDATKWTTSVAPSTTNDNAFFENAAGTAPAVTVDATTTVGSLILVNTGDGDSGNFTIPANVSLNLAGTNGLAIAHKTSNGSARNTVTISGAGSLNVTNRAANIALNGNGSSGNRAVYLTMSNLNYFAADVNRIGVADLTALQQGMVSANIGTLQLARTNIIRTAYSDNYNAVQFNTAIQLLHMGDQTAFSITSTESVKHAIWLGQTNAIFADSIGIGRARSTGSTTPTVTPPWNFGCSMKFGSAFAGLSPVAYFRGTNGGRMSLLAIGVDSGAGNVQNPTKAHVSLTGGTVDMMVDRIWIGRNRTNGTSAQQAYGGLYFDGGTVDANTVYCSYQQYANSVNCLGFICVSNTGVMKINNQLTLGYTAGGGGASGTSGQILLVNNGTMLANQINFGDQSTANNITINGGVLGITNTIGTFDHKVSTLAMTTGDLTVRINGSNTNVVYCTNLTCAGANNTINIGSLVNLPTLPATFSVISYELLVSGQNFVRGTVPSGYTASVSHNAINKTIEVTISQGVPKTLKWRGYINNNWDTTTANWLNTSNNLPATFATGDFTVFDDTTSVPTTINVAENVTPGQSLTTPGISMTNSTNNFIFTGNSILGAAGLSKSGTGSLEIQNHTEVSATINQGLIFGAGDLGGVTVTANGGFNFSGTINGGVICQSTNAVTSGTVNGSLAVQAGGIYTNNGTVVGALSISATAFLQNNGSITNIGSPTFPSNSIVINNGNLYGGNITVNGTLVDTGAGVIGLGTGAVTNTLTINGGANFIIGGTGIGTTHCGTLDPKRTRVLLNNNSTNFFKVSPGVGNTVLDAFYTDFGANNTTNGGGGIILVTNVGAPYAAGQSFTLFTGVAGSILAAGNATFPQISPLAPGPNLAWDLSTIKTDGTIRVLAVNTNPPSVIPLTVTVTPGYNTNTILINYTNTTHLEWPADRIGWRLQWQPSNIQKGITTNWLNVFGSAFTNVIDVNETFGTNWTKTNCTFFRLIYP